MKMSTKWADSIVGEHIELVYGKSLPDRDRQKGEFPVYGSNGIVGQHNQFVTKGPGIVIGRKGTVGQVTLSKKDFWPIDTTYYVKLKQDGDIFYWFYLLQTFALDQMNSHSAVPGLNRDNVYSIPVKVPSLVEQKRIAKILCDLDNKIELNQQMNKTLEAMAQALFKEWFVDFRFPGHEKVKFVDGLPEGWQYKKFGDVADVNWGDTNTTKASYALEGYATYSASGLDGKMSRFDYDCPGIVLSAIGANCGETWFASGKWSCIKNTMRILAKSNAVGIEYLFFCTFGKEFWPRRGSAQPFISQTDARNLTVLVPDAITMAEFIKVSQGLLKEMNENRLQSLTLAQTRDSLLPKLLSGTMAVDEE